MVHRWWMVIFGSVSALWLVVVGPAWALPTHEYEKHDYKYGHAGDDEKHDKKDYEKGQRNDHKFWFADSRWDDLDKDWGGKLKKHKEYDGHDFKQWGKGPGKYDPDCDPPVATPEPGTLLLLGSSLAGVGVYVRRRRQPLGGTGRNRG
jgi:hypothetical protein